VLQPTRSNRSRFVFLLLAATALSLLTLDFRGFGPLETAQDGVRGVLEPVAGAFDSAFDPARNAWHGVVDYGDVKRENDALRRRVAELEADPTRQQNAQQELDTLKAQLAIETASNVQKQVARVVSGPVSNFENNIRIDKGSDDGIATNQIVVTEAGLVGRVSEVTPNRSVIELADSRDFGVGVRLAGSVPTTFTLRGQGRGQPLEIQGEIPPGLALHDGDPLVTSGLDRSLFPPNILVGRVVGVDAAMAAAAASTAGDAGATIAPKPLTGIEVELFVKPRELSFVTVLLWKPPT
jgi:rod shape-determining protein MreC